MLIPNDGCHQCPAGVGIDPLFIMPGDFILTTKDSFFHRLIAIGQSFRFPKQYAKYTHCALVVDKQGSLIEADSEGILHRSLGDYLSKDYVYIHIKASPEDRAEAVAFANSCIQNPYGWFTALSIGLSMLTGLKFSFGFQGQEVCSGLIARSLERTQFIPPTDASHIPPALLAQMYQVS